MTKVNYKNKAFTLIELIVTIVILAILGTIAFISFQWYSRNSRDSARIADINNVKKSLAIYITDKTYYPIPDDWVNITYSWWTVWIEWTIWKNVIRNIDKVSKVVNDPLTENQYTYSITSSMTEYQIWAIFEWAWLSMNNPVINNIYARDLSQTKAMVTGTYNDHIAKVSTWGIDYILAMPSIIVTDLTNTDIWEIIENKKLVYNNYSNIPHSYNTQWIPMTWWFDYVNTNLVLYAGNFSELNWSWVLRQELIEDVKDIYSWSILNSNPSYEEVMDLDTNDQIQTNLVATKLLWKLNSQATWPITITQIADCDWPLWADAIWNTVSSITQTRNWIIWLPSNTSVYSETWSTQECRFKCEDWKIWNSWAWECQLETNYCSFDWTDLFDGNCLFSP